MREPVPIADATVFLGMHHRDPELRRRSLDFFRGHFDRRVRMSFEQIGICDAVIWQQPREIQDLYYPFMDRLHSDMEIVRGGYSARELALAAQHPELHGLAPEQALLAAQVLAEGGALATHDPELLRLSCVRSRLWDWGPAPSRPPAAFPPALEALYEASRGFVHGGQE